MQVIYRISDSGYKKVKPPYINNKNCLFNARHIFAEESWHVIADNVCSTTKDMIESTGVTNIDYVSVGHGAGTFNLALDKALSFEDNEVVYFLENDYIHKTGAAKILKEGIDLNPSFVSLYDHPDKYMNPSEGGNPYCEHRSESTRVYLSPSCHWKVTNSTTMTFAAKVSTLREVEPILRKHTSGTHPFDFQMFIELYKNNRFLITPIPGYSTHGETAWLAPLTDWSLFI